MRWNPLRPRSEGFGTLAMKSEQTGTVVFVGDPRPRRVAHLRRSSVRPTSRFLLGGAALEKADQKPSCPPHALTSPGRAACCHTPKTERTWARGKEPRPAVNHIADHFVPVDLHLTSVNTSPLTTPCTGPTSGEAGAAAVSPVTFAPFCRSVRRKLLSVVSSIVPIHVPVTSASTSMSLTQSRRVQLVLTSQNRPTWRTSRRVMPSPSLPQTDLLNYRPGLD
jgi:hypothetical protein